ncbi:MAG: ABC transporter ATP-binding protein [Lautropia sp.]
MPEVEAGLPDTDVQGRRDATHAGEAGGIQIEGVSKLFVRRGREVVALDQFGLRVAEGEFVAFVGPSGCGKSTLLNMIAGILEPSAGRIVHDGRQVRGPNRAVGYMTQVDSLLPWRTTEQNVRLPLELRGVRDADARHRCEELLGLVNLKGFAKHFPNELSGGMRKRVALAQVLAYDPRTLLMDEPFGALDAQLKLVMQKELLDIWDRSRKTVVFVTHDLSEAIALADRVVVFTGRPGRIKLEERIDLPRPRDVFKDRFTPAFQAIYERIWQALEPEIRKGEEL